VIIHEAPRNCGIGAEIAATVAEHGLYDLHAHKARDRLRHDHSTLASRIRLHPSVARIADAVARTLAE